MPTFSKSFFVCIMLFLCSFKLSAQQKQPAPVRLFFEKVYLHTDRDVYMPGDTLWYKAYLVNGQNNTPIYTSGNLYTELIEKDSSKIINREIVHLTGATGNADFVLSDSIPSGKYLLRAYTNWMRNFGDNFAFEKDITILNIQPQKATDAIKGPGNTVKIANPTKLVPQQKVSGPVIRFYPESGSLIEGVNSLVAVKAEDGYGKGVPLKGAVLSSTGDTLSAFSCDTLGMGLFVLMPAKGQAYHVGIIGNKNASFNLPQALLKGFALRISHRDTLISVIIGCSDATVTDNTGKGFTLSGKHGGKTYFKQQITIASNQTLVKIPDTMFPEGIAALTLTEDQDQAKPHCERLIYIHHAAGVNGLSIQTDKLVYRSKEKVTAHIKTNGGKASLSFAALDAGVVPEQSGNILSYLELKSELRGNVEQAARYFDTTNVNRARQLDLLLMTQGWRDFVWRRMQDTAIRISYNLENGLTVSGRVLSGNNDKPLNHVNITMFANDNKGTKLFSGGTDSLGRFMFTGLEQFGDHAIKLSASDNKGEKKGAFTIDTLSVLPLGSLKPGNPAPDTGKSVLITAAIKRQTAVIAEHQKAFKNLKEIKITASRSVILGNGTGMTSYGKDQVFDITPKDYQYKTLEWWMLQNVKGAMQSSNMDITGVVIPGMDTLGYVDPLTAKIIYRAANRPIPPEFFVNGRELYPEEEVEAEAYRKTYFPLAIDKFKRIVFKHVIGNLTNSANSKAAMITVDRYLLYIYLKDDALVGYNSGVANPELTGYYEAKTFYKPVYDNPKSLSTPDMRSTIYWEPNIITDANGEANVTFYNADPKNKIRLIVEGLTDKGVPVTATSAYTVQ